jgi:hypothetical protein
MAPVLYTTPFQVMVEPVAETTLWFHALQSAGSSLSEQNP